MQFSVNFDQDGFHFQISIKPRLFVLAIILIGIVAILITFADLIFRNIAQANQSILEPATAIVAILTSLITSYYFSKREIRKEEEHRELTLDKIKDEEKNVLAQVKTRVDHIVKEDQQ